MTNQEIPMTVYMHCCLSVRGALRTMKKRQLGRLLRDNTGRRLTADQAKDALMDELAKGHEVIPLGEPCEGFDYSGGGCPGHPEHNQANGPT